MGYLEKIFLGTMALFALAIFFIFALYFDVGDMFSGSIDRRGVISRGAAVDRLIDRIEHKVRTAPRRSNHRKGSWGNSPRVAPRFDSSRDAARKRVEKYSPRQWKKGAARVEQYRRFLRGQGFSNQAFIEMEALGQNREVLERHMPAVERFLADGEYAQAVKLLEQALRQVNPKNLKIKDVLLSRLVQAQLLANDLDAAQATSNLMLQNSEQIISLKAGTRLMETPTFKEKIEQEQQAVQHRRSKQHEFFADLQRRKLATGSWNGYMPEERAQVKAGLMRAKAEGTITDDMYQNIITQLEQGLPYRLPKRRLRDKAAAVLDKEGR